MAEQLTQVTWHIGSMREGDTRSTIRTSKAIIGNYVDDYARTIRYFVDLVMDVTTWGDTIHAKLDIGDQHSRVLPWADQPSPRNLEEWNRSYQRIEDEAEKVVREVHQILVDMVPGIHPVPIIEHDWTPRTPQPSDSNTVAHAYQ